jgi:ankyrin repeat protein
VKRRQAIVLISVPLILLLVFAWAFQRNVRQYALDRQLCSAVEADDVARVSDLLAEGADPNAREVPPPPPNGFLARMKYMLQPPRNDFSSMAVLHRATSNAEDDSDNPIVDLLIRAGADVNAEYFDLGRPLIVAAWFGNGQIIHRLLAGGADPNARMDGWTGSSEPVLFQVARRCDAATLQDMLDHGVKLDVQSEVEEVLAIAATNRDPSLISLLLDRGYSVNTRHDGSSLLIHAVSSANSAVVRLLLKRGADPNLRYDGASPGPYLKGDTALVVAQSARKSVSVNKDEVANCDVIIRLLKAHGAK